MGNYTGGSAHQLWLVRELMHNGGNMDIKIWGEGGQFMKEGREKTWGRGRGLGGGDLRGWICMAMWLKQSIEGKLLRMYMYMMSCHVATCTWCHVMLLHVHGACHVATCTWCHVMLLHVHGVMSCCYMYMVSCHVATCTWCHVMLLHVHG